MTNEQLEEITTAAVAVFERRKEVNQAERELRKSNEALRISDQSLFDLIEKSKAEKRTRL